MHNQYHGISHQQTIDTNALTVHRRDSSAWPHNECNTARVTLVTGTASAWFSVPRPQPSAEFTLYCFPYAGSGASCFFQWARAFEAHGIEVRSVQLPARENRLRDAPLTSIDAIVTALVGLLDESSRRPFGFFGHSMGATVAFELALACQRDARRGPKFLVASGASAPQLTITSDPLHELDDQQFIQAVSERYGGIPAAVLENEELLSLILPALRADMRAIETYQFSGGQSLKCPLYIYGGTEDVQVSESDIDAWQEVNPPQFTKQLLSGDHFFINDHRDLLVELITGAFRAS